MMMNRGLTKRRLLGKLLLACVLLGVAAFGAILGMICWKEAHIPPAENYDAIIVLGAQVKADGVISREVADNALQALEIDYLGLDPVDRRMLRAIIENYSGGPVGLETLAATIGEESITLEDVYEPYLMQLGFLTRTPRGRCVTRKAYEHLHMDYLGQEQLEI